MEAQGGNYMTARRPWPSLVLAAVAAAWLGAPAAAGPIPADGPGLPAALDNPTQGMAVDSASVITDQLRGSGLVAAQMNDLHGSAALAEVGGVISFIPVMPAAGGGYTVDYTTGNMSWRVVDPATGAPTSADRVNVEFTGRAQNAIVYGFSDEGLINFSLADDGVGPHGGRLARLTAPGMTYFAVWLAAAETDGRETGIGTARPWGVAQIELNPVANASNTPEPATLSLCGIGLAAVAWRRRRKG
jgi:hypothetical protein